ncbi:hypothetical protein PAHAL_2G271900 [Panicum hallii]|uniref:Uncharacterized protein n=1 Tax=Panicum hallii TaxID=206008 RepID=A0A2T8KQL7_9POAL|nr:hypothetical protein PAHAL_2G271900 [Panicum hallii]
MQGELVLARPTPHDVAQAIIAWRHPRSRASSSSSRRSPLVRKDSDPATSKSEVCLPVQRFQQATSSM